MKEIFSVAFLTFKQAVRSRLFTGVIFFFVFYAFFCTILGELSPGETQKVMRSAALAGIEITAVGLIVFTIVFNFYREKESHMLDIYLSNFKRSDYVTGKILSYIFISLFYIILSGLCCWLLLSLYGAFSPAFLAALYSIFLKVSIVVSFCLIFTSFFSSPIIALLITFFLYVSAQVGRAALDAVNLYGRKLQQTVVLLFYSLLPNMDKLDINNLAAYGKVPDFVFFFQITFYSLLYISLLWLINILLWQKKEY
ncbi:MAG: hypothetical protein ABH858_05630 [Candidatus Omnitrophota bacterium]